MKNGLDGHEDSRSNVVSFTSAGRRSAREARRSTDGASQRPAIGQWLIGALMVVLAAGGVVALAAPLLRAAGVLGG